MKYPPPAQFQSFESESVPLPPDTPAAPRPVGRPRELPWELAVLEKIETLGQLQRGWDSHDGLPLTAAAKRVALDALKLLKEHDLPVPAVVLGSGGTLHLEWQLAGKALELGFGEGDAMEFVKVDAQGNVEEGVETSVVQARLDSLVEWLNAA